LEELWNDVGKHMQEMFEAHEKGFVTKGRL